MMMRERKMSEGEERVVRRLRLWAGAIEAGEVEGAEMVQRYDGDTRQEVLEVRIVGTRVLDVGEWEGKG
jgi:hypothetical protein